MKHLALAVLVSLALTACEETPPPTIKDIDPDIISVEERPGATGTELRIVWQLAGMSPEADMSSAALGMKKTLKAITTRFSEQKATEVHFILKGQLVDQYGNQSLEDVYEIPFVMSEVRKMNFTSDALTHWMLLNLSGQPKQLAPAGAGLMTAYCADADNARLADRFCARTANGAATQELSNSSASKGLSALEAQQLAADTLAYIEQYQAALGDDAVMNEDALNKVFRSAAYQTLHDRWPGSQVRDEVADRYSSCRVLLISASEYAEAQNKFAHNLLQEKQVSPLRKQYKANVNMCRKLVSEAKI